MGCCGCDSKTGAKLIYLNEPAINLLRAMPRMAGNPHVIAGKKAGASLVNLTSHGVAYAPKQA